MPNHLKMQRNKEIIEAYGTGNYSLQALGDQHGISRQRVQQILNKSIELPKRIVYKKKKIPYRIEKVIFLYLGKKGIKTVKEISDWLQVSQYLIFQSLGDLNTRDLTTMSLGPELLEDIRAGIPYKDLLGKYNKERTSTLHAILQRYCRLTNNEFPSRYSKQ